MKMKTQEFHKNTAKSWKTKPTVYFAVVGVVNQDGCFRRGSHDNAHGMLEAWLLNLLFETRRSYIGRLPVV